MAHEDFEPMGNATVAAFVVFTTSPFQKLSSGVLLPTKKMVLLTTKRFRLLPRGESMTGAVAAFIQNSV